MVEDEVQEETEKKDAKYITATLSKTEDIDLISRYGRLVKIGGFSAREVFEAGVLALVDSEQYQNALKSLKDEMKD